MKGTDFYFTHADKKVEGYYGLGYVAGFSPNLPDFVVIGFDDDRGWELSTCPYRFVGNDRYKTYFFAHVNEVRLISSFECFVREHGGEEVFVDGIKGFIVGYNPTQNSVIVGFKSNAKGWKGLFDDDIILAEYVGINVYLYVSMKELTPHKYSPSNGDIVYVKFENDLECIFIYSTKTSQDIILPYAGLIIEPNNNKKIFCGYSFVIDASDVIKIRPCTKEEKTKLLEGLKKKMHLGQQKNYKKKE